MRLFHYTRTEVMQLWSKLWCATTGLPITSGTRSLEVGEPAPRLALRRAPWGELAPSFSVRVEARGHEHTIRPTPSGSRRPLHNAILAELELLAQNLRGGVPASRSREHEALRTHNVECELWGLNAWWRVPLPQLTADLPPYVRAAAAHGMRSRVAERTHLRKVARQRLLTFRRFLK